MVEPKIFNESDDELRIRIGTVLNRIFGDLNQLLKPFAFVSAFESYGDKWEETLITQNRRKRSRSRRSEPDISWDTPSLIRAIINNPTKTRTMSRLSVNALHSFLHERSMLLTTIAFLRL